MNKYTIENLEPTIIWKYFKAICQIPHPSKHEAQITAFMKQFGEQHHLETIVDHVGNVIILKPATTGYENRKRVLLQAHLDMVPQKNSGVSHDFKQDPIIPYIDGDWITAENTTLGADNGIAIAIMMALLAAKNINHGPLEMLFTVDEESGMTGAIGLSDHVLKSDIMLNLDTEDEGIFFIGCAGGINTNVSLAYQEEQTPKHTIALQLKLSGLRGGHSGVDIILNRGNANKMITHLLHDLADITTLNIHRLNGGDLHNAIPREAVTTFVIPTEDQGKITQKITELSTQIKHELKDIDPDVELSLTTIEMPEKIMNPTTQQQILKTINACPNGVIAMSQTVDNLVETSSNLAEVQLENGRFSISTSQRSSVESAKYEVSHKIRTLFDAIKATTTAGCDYPGWEPNPNSEILNHAKTVYQSLFHKAPEILAIHAGLECGLIGAKYPNMDMLSIGPTIKFPHSPDEKLEIKSVEKFWTFLKALLKNLPIEEKH